MESSVDEVGPVEVEENGCESRDDPVWDNQIVGQEEGDVSKTIENGIHEVVEEHKPEPLSKNNVQVHVGEHREVSGSLRTEDLIIDRTLHQRPRLELINRHLKEVLDVAKVEEWNQTWQHDLQSEHDELRVQHSEHVVEKRIDVSSGLAVVGTHE